MVISEALAERAAELLREDAPERLSGEVLWEALRRAESALSRNRDAEERVCIPSYVRAPQSPTEHARDAMDDPRYVHGLGR